MDEHKAHRVSKVKKAAAKKGKSGEGNDPRAFAINNINKTRRRVVRSLDQETKKHHAPAVDRTPDIPPPIIVAVVGPPQVGKTTLIRSLVKRYAKVTLHTIQGPVTVVSGKTRRITFMECNNDINSMLDIGKIADLVLLLVDGSFGFEMETFEFLNVLQAHGFPKVMGVLTHLDRLKNSKQLRRVKKELKHRFWTEIYQGAKLFYFSGISHGMYPKTEVNNLTRFVSVIKFRPLTWRNTHPYVLADRMEDITDSEDKRLNPKIDRKIAVFGYVRGTFLKDNMKVHIPGCGDLDVQGISFLADPCPPPQSQNEAQKKRRRLDERDKLIYAPMSDVGGILYDRDATFVDMPSIQSQPDDAAKLPNDEFGYVDPREELIRELKSQPGIPQRQESDDDEDEAIEDTEELDQGLQLFSGGVSLKLKDVVQDEESDDEDVDATEAETGAEDESDDDSDREENDIMLRKLPSEKPEFKDGRTRRRAMFDSDEAVEKPDAVFEFEDDDCESDEESNSLELRRDENDDENESENEDENDDEIDENDDDDDDAQLAEMSFETFNQFMASSKLPKSDESDEEDSRAGSEQLESYSEVDGTTGPSAPAILAHNLSQLPITEQADVRWKDNLVEKAAKAFLSRQNANLQELVYGQRESLSPEAHEAGATNSTAREDEDELFKVREETEEEEVEDSSRTLAMNTVLMDWTNHEVQESIRNYFVTGQWNEGEDAAALLKEQEDDEVYGDFEDLETGEVRETDAAEGGQKESENKDAKTKKDMTPAERRSYKKARMKALFDEEYDKVTGGGQTHFDEVKEAIAEQNQFNKSAFEGESEEMRVQLEGYRPGLYVRIVLDGVPCELVENFDPSYPLFLGGLLSQESDIGFVQVRFKKHRWYPKILKSRDPVIFSLGWRRFETIPIYAIQDVNFRNRMLKYTPEHMHCIASFYGPITAPGTGCLSIQTVSQTTSNFRITGTGVITELDKSSDVVKKLKLIGYPMKIHKNTAFIKDMFTSALEVAKFEGAAIRTVSGIRGQIKKAQKAPEGSFRATFEDKILMSDIIFLKTWYPVRPPEYYNPISSLLLGDKKAWQGMKTTGRLRFERGLKATQRSDSEYKPIERKVRRFNALKIPKRIEANLPFKNKPKLQAARKRDGLTQKRALISEPKDAKIERLMQQLNTIKRDKERKRGQAQAQRKAEYLKAKAIAEQKSADKRKIELRKLHRQRGLEERKRASKEARQTSKPEPKRRKNN